MDLIFLPLLFVLMYLLLIRPQQSRMKRQRALLASLQAGDEVLTAGGVVGTISVLGDEEIRLDVGSGVELRVLRGAITRRIGPEVATGAEAGSTTAGDDAAPAGDDEAPDAGEGR